MKKNNNHISLPLLKGHLMSKDPNATYGTFKYPVEITLTRKFKFSKEQEPITAETPLSEQLSFHLKAVRSVLTKGILLKLQSLSQFLVKISTLSHGH